MGLNVESIGILLAISAVIAIVAARTRIPYTVCLVFAGIGLALIPQFPTISLTRDLIFTVFLPPLIFEAAFHVRWPELRRDLVPISVLASLGTAISIAAVAGGMRWGAGWAWPVATTFAVLISATDPVAVLATFRDLGVKGRLRLFVEAESLLNDGVAAVAFAILVALVAGTHISASGATGQFLATFFGGGLCGAAIAGLALALMGGTEDHLVEIALTAAVAYSSFLAAERLGASGVLATLVAGLVMGNFGHLGGLSERGREAVVAFWEFAAFAVNSVIFLMIGSNLAHQRLGGMAVPILVAISVVLAGRAIAVYGVLGSFAGSRWRVGWADQHILVLGGLRGALALALALGLPDGFPQRELIRSTCFVVVAFSVVAQGLAVKLAMRHKPKIA